LLEATNPPLSPLLHWYFQHTRGLLELRTLWYYLNMMGVSKTERFLITLKMLVNPQWVSDAYVSKQALSPEENYLRDYLKTVVRSIELYRPQPYAGVVHLFLTPDRQSRPPVWQQWEKLAQHGVRRYPIAGNHRTMGDEPHVKVLAQQLQKATDQ
jgi:hypothetical protein